MPSADALFRVVQVANITEKHPEPFEHRGKLDLDKVGFAALCHGTKLEIQKAWLVI